MQRRCNTPDRSEANDPSEPEHSEEVHERRTSKLPKRQRGPHPASRHSNGPNALLPGREGYDRYLGSGDGTLGSCLGLGCDGRRGCWPEGFSFMGNDGAPDDFVFEVDEETGLVAYGEEELHAVSGGRRRGKARRMRRVSDS